MAKLIVRKALSKLSKLLSNLAEYPLVGESEHFGCFQFLCSEL